MQKLKCLAGNQKRKESCVLSSYACVFHCTSHFSVVFSFLMWKIEGVEFDEI